MNRILTGYHNAVLGYWQLRARGNGPFLLVSIRVYSWLNKKLNKNHEWTRMDTNNTSDFNHL